MRPRKGESSDKSSPSKSDGDGERSFESATTSTSVEEEFVPNRLTTQPIEIEYLSLVKESPRERYEGIYGYGSTVCYLIDDLNLNIANPI